MTAENRNESASTILGQFWNGTLQMQMQMKRVEP